MSGYRLDLQNIEDAVDGYEGSDADFESLLLASKKAQAEMLAKVREPAVCTRHGACPEDCAWRGGGA